MTPIIASVFRHYWDWITLCFLLVVAWHWPRFGNRAIAPLESCFSRFASRKTLAIVSTILLVATLRVCLLPFFPIRPPAAHDEYSYLLAADTFAHGRLTNPPHTMPIYFDTFVEIQKPTYASMFPPAQGAFLAIGQILGRPWFGVLASVALMFGAFLWMLQGWFSPRWALLGTALPFLRFGEFSYWMNTYWGGAVAFLGSSLVLGAVPRITSKRSLSATFVLCIGTGLLLNSRPCEGVILLLPVFTYLAIWTIKNAAQWRALLPKVILPFLLMMGLNAAFILYYDFKVTGHPFLIPHELWNRQYMGNSPFVWSSAQPPRVFQNPQFDVMFNHWVPALYKRGWNGFVSAVEGRLADFGQFYLGSTMAAPVLALPWLFLDRRSRLLVCFFISSLIMLFTVAWFYPHYEAPLAPLLFALVIQMFRHMRRWTYRTRAVGIGLSRATILAAAIYFIGCGTITLRQPRGDLPLGYGWEPRWARQEMLDELNRTQGEHLVIVRYGNLHPVHQDGVFNSADIDHSKVVWAREIPGISMQPLLDYYKDRRVWLIQPDQDPWHLQPYASLPSIVRTAESTNFAPSYSHHAKNN